MDLGFDPIELLRLPTLKKAAVVAGIVVVLSGGYWYFFLQEVLDSIDVVDKKLAEQEEKIASHRAMLARLPKLRQELAELKLLEAKAAQKLPSKQEIPALLTDISEAGHEQGLEFLLFAPRSELPVEIHAEVPVDVNIRGSFHSIVTFMDKVTRMSRIATFSNLAMVPKDALVQMTARLTTYRFLEPNDAGFKSPTSVPTTKK